ncbi:MAG TPA: UbiA family prenyltransferase [Thermoanaerobaculia bacterium]|jgi:4-hydroxybenzoate polyprenyltransferase|nr:UbiA family prenyltransferase [Thermoanaerobaculia bacterium]
MTKLRVIFKAMRLSEQPTIVVSFLYGILDQGSLYHPPGRCYASTGIGLLLISIAAFILNEYADKGMNAKRLDRIPSEISGRATSIMVSSLSTLGLALGFYGGARICTAGTLLFGLLYSIPNIHLKTKPVLDLVSLGFSFVILPYMAPLEITASHGGLPHNPNISLLNLTFLLLFLSACNLIAMIRDIDADSEAGVHNTTVALGVRRSLLFGRYLAAASFMVGTAVLYRSIAWWYLPMFLCIPVVASIFAFGLGALSDRDKIQCYFASSARAGIMTGNALMISLSLIALFSCVIFR